MEITAKKSTIFGPYLVMSVSKIKHQQHNLIIFLISVQVFFFSEGLLAMNLPFLHASCTKKM
jgi:hypothetical protein